MCSITLEQIYVRDTGLYFAEDAWSPFVKIWDYVCCSLFYRDPWTTCRMLSVSEQADLLPSRLALCALTPLRMSMSDMASYGDGTRSGMFESFSTLNT